MFDINCSILKLDIEKAKIEIQKLKDLGYTGVILTTTVLDNGNYEMEEALNKFNILKDAFPDLKICFGNEINYHYTIIHRIKKNDVIGLNYSNYMLIKLPIDKKPELFKAMINSLSDYKIILSNVDEYKYFDYKDFLEMKKDGIYFLSKIGNIKKCKVKKLIKNKLLDYLVTYDEVTEIPAKAKKILNNDDFEKLFVKNYKEIIK